MVKFIFEINHRKDARKSKVFKKVRAIDARSHSVVNKEMDTKGLRYAFYANVIYLRHFTGEAAAPHPNANCGTNHEFNLERLTAEINQHHQLAIQKQFRFTKEG